jgi:hypothetical protein
MTLTKLPIPVDYMVREPDHRFTRLASEAELTAVAQALTGRGMRAIVVDTSEQAKDEVLKLIPHGSQVFTVSSKTIAQIGIAEVLNETGLYQSIRKVLNTLDRRTQSSEMRKVASSPEIVVGSVQAITQDGAVLDVSMSGSQIPAYASGAGKVIWVVGAQKIVKDIDEGLQRVYAYCLPLENLRTMDVYGVPSEVNKILIVNREPKPDRITVILVKQNLGF